MNPATRERVIEHLRERDQAMQKKHRCEYLDVECEVGSDDDSCSDTGSGVDTETPTEDISDDSIDGMSAETGAESSCESSQYESTEGSVDYDYVRRRYEEAQRRGPK